MPLKLTTYYHGKDIPELPGKNTFHSKELFLIYEATPGYTPWQQKTADRWHACLLPSAKQRSGSLLL